MAEWFKALVLKINVSKDTVSSNLTLPALFFFYLMLFMFNKFKYLKYNLNQNNTIYTSNNNNYFEFGIKKKSFLNQKSKLLKKSINNDIFYRNKKYNKLKINLFSTPLYILYIRSTLRGFHINVSDSNGRVLKMFSAGQLGYKKSQRYNQVSLVALGQEVLSFFKPLNTNFKVNIILKGFSSKRGKLIKFFTRSFLKRSIVSIIDLSDLPYNGCRPKKLRRK